MHHSGTALNRTEQHLLGTALLSNMFHHQMHLSTWLQFPAGVHCERDLTLLAMHRVVVIHMATVCLCCALERQPARVLVTNRHRGLAALLQRTAR
jgi:hypothetical protein